MTDIVINLIGMVVMVTGTIAVFRVISMLYKERAAQPDKSACNYVDMKTFKVTLCEDIPV
ncbi:MAG: hypothetical protein LBT59_14645 [Clostridiales bacterium]|jgi:hypothetical protein|nr:hypothetical protein [Clostridiales bacterium]